MVSGELTSSCFSSLVSIGNPLLLCWKSSPALLDVPQEVRPSQGGAGSSQAVVAPLQHLLAASPGFGVSSSHGFGHRNPVAPLQDPELHLPPPSSLNWGLRPFTEVFCLCPVPVLTQAPEEEAGCSQHERFLPKEPCFPQMVQDCASLSLETQEQMGCSSWALNCVSARTWSSFAKPSYWCVGLSCSYLGSIRDQ